MGSGPHDLARDVLDAEFERRSPERYRSLHRVVHDHVVAGLRAATGPDRQLLAQHLLYLHRKSPLTAVFYALRAQGSAAVVPARRRGARPGPGDHRRVRGSGIRPARRRLARRAAGRPQRGARTARAWPPSPTTCSTRPARRWSTGTRSSGPCWSTSRRRGRSALASRSTSSASSVAGASTSATGTRCWPARCRRCSLWVSRPLAWSFVVVLDAEFWGPFFDYLAFGRVLEIEVGGLSACRLRHATGGASRSTGGST